MVVTTRRAVKQGKHAERAQCHLFVKTTRRYGSLNATYHYHSGPHTLQASLVNLRELSLTNLSRFCADISHFPALAAARQLTAAGFLSGKSQVQSDAPALQTQYTCLLPLKL